MATANKSASKAAASKAAAALAAPPALADSFGAVALTQLASKGATGNNPLDPHTNGSPVAPAPAEAPVAPANVPTVITKETCNGITKPAPDTLCGQVWAKCADITALQGSPATPAQVLIALPSINVHTVKTQHARWRAFTGLVGRTVREAPVASNVVELAKTALLAAGFDQAVDIGGLSACKSPHDLVAWLAARAPAPVAPVAPATE